MVIFGPLFLKKLKSFKMLPFTMRRKNRCFDGAFFKKIYPFRIYGDLDGVLMRVFQKIFKKCILHHTQKKTSF